MKKNEIIIINSIEKLHEIFDFGNYKHPLISLVNLANFKYPKSLESFKIVFELYSVILKTHCRGDVIYGRTHYDFNKGILNFSAINQTILVENVIEDEEQEGWALFFHPDLIRRSSLGEKIKSYGFFDYNLSEALHMSENERVLLNSLVKEIENEYSERIDNFSHNVINTTLELLMNYCERFYARQFITRENINKDVVESLETFLQERIYSDELELKGIPTVKECANEMCLSANYLSDLLKKETGKNTQEYIHLYLIDRAKNLLLNTNISITEIAMKLGFEYPDYFSKLFKKRVGLSPNKFRNSVS